MGCWKDIKEPCGSCFGCMNMDPASISLDFKLRNGTAITSICVFD
jgi:hypothetical protein